MPLSSGFIVAVRMRLDPAPEPITSGLSACLLSIYFDSSFLLKYDLCSGCTLCIVN